MLASKGNLGFGSVRIIYRNIDVTDWLLVCLLGIVEGLTEFLPVSSTGHLILFGDLFGFSGEKAASFDIFIQLGAILAVVVLYRRRFLALLNFSTAERETFQGWSGLKKIACGALPVLIIGFIFHAAIKRYLFNSLSVAIALLVGGVVMIVVEKRQRRASTLALEDLSYRQCFLVGLFQCFSLWSGISRSGSTIVGGLLVGLDRKVAAEFSFLVAVPVMCAATGYDLLKSLSLLSAADLNMFALGFIVSFVSALIAVRVFVELIQRWSLLPFAYYRILLAALTLFLK